MGGRDIVAQLLDSTLRRLSFHRDGMTPPPPARAIASERDFVEFINDAQRAVGESAKRLSPRCSTDLYERASREAADWFESLPLDAPALFPVSWAGEHASAGGSTSGASSLNCGITSSRFGWLSALTRSLIARYLGAVIDVAVRGLPHAFRDVSAEPGQTVAIDINGPSGGRWTLEREQRALDAVARRAISSNDVVFG